MKKSEGATVIGEIGHLFLQLEQEIKKLKLENDIMKNRVKSVSNQVKDRRTLVTQVS